MECDLCQRHFNKRRSAVCASCVKASLYRPRIDHVTALLDREKAHTHAEAVVRPGNDGVLAALPEDADWDAITAGISVRSHERAKAETEAIELRMETISAGIEELRQQVDDHKRYIAEQKQRRQERKNTLASERQVLEQRTPTAPEPIQAAIKKANRHLDRVHTKTAEAREYLCKEVGKLCGLHRTKDRKGRPEYYLNGLLIPHLKDLNCINGRIRGERLSRSSDQSLAQPHELISASLDNVCSFLGICCHYLSVRLPAEIVLPHDDFPHAVLMQPEASYKADEPRYPAFGSKASTPSQSRTLPAASERGKARVLQLDKPLPQLQKEDFKTHALFLEGVSLLAYDIAWLCRTQGIVEGHPSLDDVCDIGRNLYALAGKDVRPLKPSLERRKTSTTDDTGTNIPSDVGFGRFSHSSACHGLAGHEGYAMFAPDVWKVSIRTVTDKLSSYLRNEASKSEWEFIDDNEWDDVLPHDEPVMIGGTSVQRPLDAKAAAMSVMSVAPHDGTGDFDAKAPANKGKGNSGWMKVRGRGGTGDV